MDCLGTGADIKVSPNFTPSSPKWRPFSSYLHKCEKRPPLLLAQLGGQFIAQSWQCTVYSVYSVQRVQCTVCTAYSVYSVQCTAGTVYSVQRVQCSVYSTYSVQRTAYTVHCE